MASNQWRELDGSVWETTEKRHLIRNDDSRNGVTHDYDGHLETRKAGGYVACFCCTEPFIAQISNEVGLAVKR